MRGSISEHRGRGAGARGRDGCPATRIESFSLIDSRLTVMTYSDDDQGDNGGGDKEEEEDEDDERR